MLAKLSVLEEKVLKFLLENPEANPREIADGIGISLQRVRIALYKLRDRGYVVRGSRGYVVVRSRLSNELRHELKDEKMLAQQSLIVKIREHIPSQKPTVEETKQANEGKVSIKEVIKSEGFVSRDEFEKTINELKEKINELVEKIHTLERKVNEIAKSLKFSMFKVERKASKEYDELLAILKDRKVMTISEVKEYIRMKSLTKSLEDYIKEHKVKIVADLVVDKDFYQEFISKMPILVTNVKDLRQEEKALLRALIEEGLVYLHAAREYRFIGEEY